MSLREGRFELMYSSLFSNHGQSIYSIEAMQSVYNALYVDKVSVLSPIITDKQTNGERVWKTSLSFILLADACQWQTIVIFYTFISFSLLKLLRFLGCYSNKLFIWSLCLQLWHANNICIFCPCAAFRRIDIFSSASRQIFILHTLRLFSLQ